MQTDTLNGDCYGFNTGWVAAIVTGGTLPYTYEWRQPPDNTIIGISDTMFNAYAGYYTITVYDFYSNVINGEATISQPDSVELFFNYSDSVCFNENTGWAKVTPTGGVPPYTYLWDDATLSTQDSIYNLPSGIYTVIVTDAKLCQTIDNIEIIENPQIIVDAQTSSSLICSGDSVQLSSFANGGTPPYVTYYWTPVVSLNNPNLQNPFAYINLNAQ